MPLRDATVFSLVSYQSLLTWLSGQHPAELRHWPMKERLKRSQKGQNEFQLRRKQKLEH